MTLSANMVTETEGEKAQGQADKRLTQSSSPPSLRAALGGGQERAMVPVSSPSGSTSGLVGEWVWPDPSKPGEARFVLCDEREVKLWDLVEQSGQSACDELTTAESGLDEALRRVKVARRTASSELLSLARVSLNDPFLVFGG
jgi:hypothetical protein